MSDIEKNGSILREIRARTAALEACEGHVFERLPPEDPRCFGARRWGCTRCGQAVDASYGVAYMQGLSHASKGHDKSKVFPPDAKVFV